MPGDGPLYYWDACIFLAWIKDEQRASGEMDGVREIIERAKKRDCRIMTSVVTVVEVLEGKTPVGVETLLDGLMRRVLRAGIDIKVAKAAHDIRNYYSRRGLRVTTPDALHIATAILHRADEFHTFDDRLISLSGDVAGHRLVVCKPEARNPQLDLRSHP